MCWALHRELYPKIWQKGKPQTQIFGANVVDAVLSGTNYACSQKGCVILANAIERLRWEDFLKHIDLHEFCGFEKPLKAFQIARASKNPEESKSSDLICLSQCQVIKQEIETFSKTCPERSEICALCEKCPNTELFLVRIFLYSDWKPENKDQKKLRIWTLFRQW